MEIKKLIKWFVMGKQKSVNKLVIKKTIRVCEK